MNSFLQAAVLTVFPAAMVLAAFSDLFTMRVSNRLTLGLTVAFFIIVPWSGMSFETIGVHVAVCFGMLVMGIVLFVPGWIGGGDAKLIAAISLWLGFEPLGHFLLVSAAFGGVLTIVLLKFRTFPLPQWAGSQPWITRLHRADRGAPYCIALAAGGLSAYTYSDLFLLAATSARFGY